MKNFPEMRQSRGDTCHAMNDSTSYTNCRDGGSKVLLLFTIYRDTESRYCSRQCPRQWTYQALKNSLSGALVRGRLEWRGKLEQRDARESVLSTDDPNDSSRGRR